MAIKMIPVKCPQCGADLTIEEGRQSLYCQYCGAKVIVQNENEHIYHTIDDAAVKQAETDRIVKLKQMELAEKKESAREKYKSFKIKLSIILGIIAIVCIGIGFNVDDEAGAGFGVAGMFAGLILIYSWVLDPNKEDNDDSDGRVKVPDSISDYEKKSYVAIESAFRSAGFTNVKCVPLNDLTTGLLKKPDWVESITINGRSITSGGRKFFPDASVVISYHSFSGK